MLKNKSSLAVTLAVVPLVGLVSLVTNALTGDPVAQMLATGLMGFLGIGALLHGGYVMYQKMAAGQNVNWIVIFTAAVGVGLIVMLR